MKAKHPANRLVVPKELVGDLSKSAADLAKEIAKDYKKGKDDDEDLIEALQVRIMFARNIRNLNDIPVALKLILNLIFLVCKIYQLNYILASMPLD